MSDPVIFLLGATGYVGSQFLIFLGQTLSNLSVRALVRSLNKDRETWLQQTHPNLTVIEGDLDDTELIEEQARKADIVINIASCDHISCCQGRPSLFLHKLTLHLLRCMFSYFIRFIETFYGQPKGAAYTIAYLWHRNLKR